jgi:PKD repeat protein
MEGGPGLTTLFSGSLETFARGGNGGPDGGASVPNFLANSGNGGSGASGSGGVGENGSSGIVVIRYDANADEATTTGDPEIVIATGYRIYIFRENGTITFPQNGSPVVNFTAVPRLGLAPLTVSFTDQSTNSPTSWLWDFMNDGLVTSSLQNPNYTYANPGNYTVKLTASNSIGPGSKTETNYITVSAPVVPNSNYTVLEIPGTGPNNGVNPPDVIDSSPNNYDMDVPFGGIYQGSFTPYATPAGYWGTYFGTNGCRLSTPDSSEFRMGTGDFTMEGWFYLTANNLDYVFLSNILYSGASNLAGIRFGNAGFGYKLQVYIDSSSVNTVWSTNLTQDNFLNQWTHIAFTRQAGVCRLFLDGVIQNLNNGINPGSYPFSSFTDNTDITTGYYSLGYTAPYSAMGYFSNFRVVKGTALYINNFSPAIVPLASVSGTSLLFCQTAGIMDNSSNRFPITVLDSVETTMFGPFASSNTYSTSTTGGSLWFSNSYCYVNAYGAQPGAGDFTFEFWIKFNDIKAQTGLFHQEPGIIAIAYNNLITVSAAGLSFSCGAATPVGSWDHIALVRSGTTVSLYQNGKIQGYG